MKWLALAVLPLMLPIAARARAAETNITAEAILARVWANRSLKDFSLKARLFVTREKIVPVEILVKNTPDEARTIYRAGKTQLLVVQPEHGEPRYYLQGAGELTGARRTKDFLGSHFSDYDLGMPFLQWPNPKFQGEGRVLGRDCYIIETKASGEPYARAKLWIDQEYFALLRAEAYDENENLVRRFAITSFKRIGEVWVPHGIEIAFVPPGQALPSEEKSRLEVYEGSYDTQLPATWFSPASFAVEPGGVGGNHRQSEMISGAWGSTACHDDLPIVQLQLQVADFRQAADLLFNIQQRAFEAEIAFDRVFFLVGGMILENFEFAFDVHRCPDDINIEPLGVDVITTKIPWTSHNNLSSSRVMPRLEYSHLGERSQDNKNHTV